jgi:PGF-CTERM protein
LGSVPVDGTCEVVVGPDGETAFLAATSGFATVDVSDPREPTVLVDRRDVLADRERGPLAAIRDAKLDGDRLAVVGPANPQGDGETRGAMVLYDVADPADPQRVSVHETDYAIHNAFLADGRAYLSQFDDRRVGMVVVDVGDDDPERVGRWSLLDVNERWASVPLSLFPVHDLWVHGTTVYVAHWDAGTWLLDASDPADPTAIASIGGRPPGELAALSGSAAREASLTPPGNHHYATVNDDASLLGIGVESWAVDGEGGPGGITLYDVTDPAEPRELGRIAPPATDEPERGGIWTTAHNFALVGERLYSAWYRGGVAVHDVSDPQSPDELARWRNTEETSFWAARLAVPGEFFVASSWNQYGAMPEAAGLYTFPDPASGRGPATANGSSTASGPATTTGAAGRGSTIGRETGDANGSAGATSSGSTTPDSAGSSATRSATAPAGGAAGSRADAAAATAPAGDTATTDATATDATATDGPGFGVLAALAGLGVGTWRQLRRNAD